MGQILFLQHLTSEYINNIQQNAKITVYLKKWQFIPQTTGTLC